MSRCSRMVGVFAVLVLLPLVACSPSSTSTKKSGGATVLNWYVGPERVDTKVLAQACSDGSDGKFTIRVKRLPDDTDARHSELVKRLAAKDPDIDLFSLDSAWTSEFAKAQYLAPVPQEREKTYSEDVFPEALKAATYDGSLVAAPWWFDPQLLWYRPTVAERAGLDMTKTITWDQLIAGARRVGTTIGVDDFYGHSLSGLVNSLVVGHGGSLLSGMSRQPDIGLDTAAGAKAADIVSELSKESAEPEPSSQAVETFVGPRGGFLIAGSSVLSDPRLAAITAATKWAPYPVANDDGKSSDDAKRIAPVSGMELAVPLYAPHSNASYDAIDCLTSNTTMQAIMASTGHSAARESVYDSDGFDSIYPMGKVTRPAVKDGVALPRTPYWHLAEDGLNHSWLPLGSVTSDKTPERSGQRVGALVAGELP